MTKLETASMTVWRLAELTDVLGKWTEGRPRQALFWAGLGLRVVGGILDHVDDPEKPKPEQENKEVIWSREC